MEAQALSSVGKWAVKKKWQISDWLYQHPTMPKNRCVQLRYFNKVIGKLTMKPPTHVTYMADDSHVESMDRTLVAREADIGLL
ncbi:hypothetical protein Tco_1215999 [Tanacetum coccineum]